MKQGLFILLLLLLAIVMRTIEGIIAATTLTSTKAIDSAPRGSKNTVPLLTTKALALPSGRTTMMIIAASPFLYRKRPRPLLRLRNRKGKHIPLCRKTSLSFLLQPFPLRPNGQRPKEALDFSWRKHPNNTTDKKVIFNIQ